MTVRQLQTECDSAELVEWMAMAQLEPFGGPIDDLRATIGSAFVVNSLLRMFGDKDSPLIDARQIIPWYEREPDKLLFDPSSPGYDKQAHMQAIRDLLLSKATKDNPT